MEAWSLHMLALVQLGHGEFVESVVHAREGLKIFRDAGDVGGITLVLDDLASIAVGAGDFPRAGRLYGAARNLQAKSGTMLANYVEETYTTYNAPSPRSVLSPEDLDRYVAEGASMGLDEVVAYAMEEAKPVA